MARKKKKKTSPRARPNTKELDAWIEKESTGGKGCPLCTPTVKAELQRVERRLRSHKPLPARVSMRALGRWLESRGLVSLSDGLLTKSMQRKCHSKFYNYLKGLE